MCRVTVNFWGGLFVIFSARTPLQSTSFALSSLTSRPFTAFTRRLYKITNLYSLIFNFRLFFFIIFSIN